MEKIRTPKILDIKAYRIEKGLNQFQFWSAFGVTQSGGSRYENGREIPTPVAILLVLLDQNMISRDTLQQAKLIAESRGH